MNRDHCKAILANLDLIRHFAEGGDIGHRAPNCHGDMMPISCARGIGLGGLKPDGSTWYLRLKPRYRMNQQSRVMERIMWEWPAVPKDSDVIYCETESK